MSELAIETDESPTPASKPKLIIPIGGRHLLISQAVGRARPDSFRREQLKWLETNHPERYLFITGMYSVMMGARNSPLITIADPYMMGCVMADHAIRVCIRDDPETYERLRVNYRFITDKVTEQRRHFLAQTTPNIPIPLWNNEEALQKLFDESDLIPVLMSMKHDFAREAAATSIGFYCLAEPPQAFETMQLPAPSPATS